MLKDILLYESLHILDLTEYIQVDNSGTMDFQEFKIFWDKFKKWMVCIDKHFKVLFCLSISLGKLLKTYCGMKNTYNKL